MAITLFQSGFRGLVFPPESQQALIGYAREGLRFSAERIQKFAVLNTMLNMPSPK